GTGQFGAIQAVAPSLGIEVIPINLRDAGEIERTVAAFARTANGGLIVTASGWANAHRELIVKLAARHKLPTVYYARFFVTGGGLGSYGPDPLDPYLQGGGCRAPTLQGEETARLPPPKHTQIQTSS